MEPEEEWLYQKAVQIAAWAEEAAAEERRRAEQVPVRFRESLIGLYVEVAEGRARAQHDFICLLFDVGEEKLCADVSARLAASARSREALRERQMGKEQPWNGRG